MSDDKSTITTARSEVNDDSRSYEESGSEKADKTHRKNASRIKPKKKIDTEDSDVRGLAKALGDPKASADKKVREVLKAIQRVQAGGKERGKDPSANAMKYLSRCDGGAGVFTDTRVLDAVADLTEAWANSFRVQYYAVVFFHRIFRDFLCPSSIQEQQESGDTSQATSQQAQMSAGTALPLVNRMFRIITAAMGRHASKPEYQVQVARAVDLFTSGGVPGFDPDYEILISGGCFVEGFVGGLGASPGGDSSYCTHVFSTLNFLCGRSFEARVRVSSADGIAAVGAAMQHASHRRHTRIQGLGCELLRKLMICDERLEDQLGKGLKAVFAAMLLHPDDLSVQEQGALAIAAVFANQEVYDDNFSPKILEIVSTALSNFPRSKKLHFCAKCLRRDTDSRAKKAARRGVCSATLTPRCTEHPAPTPQQQQQQQQQQRLGDNDDLFFCDDCCVLQRMHRCFTCDGKFSSRKYCDVCWKTVHSGHTGASFFSYAVCATPAVIAATSKASSVPPGSPPTATAAPPVSFGPIELSSATLSFGLAKHKGTVGKEYVESLKLTNTSKTLRSFRVASLVSEKYVLTVSPYTGVLAPGQSVMLTFSFTFKCTTTFDARIPIISSLRGSEGSKTTTTTPDRTSGSSSGNSSRKSSDADPITAIITCKIRSKNSVKIDPDELSLEKEPIGEGGYGIVYRGRYRAQAVAVKVLKDQDQDPAKLFKKFTKEVELLEIMRHPCIVLFVGASYITGRLSIVSEYCPYGSLSSVFKSEYKSKMTYVARLRCFYDIACAMAYMHKSGIMHRDLKPGNALLVSFDTGSVMCKLTDFGLTCDLSSVDSPLVLARCGTFTYEAPEVFTLKAYDKSSDVYSYGLTMVHVITGSKPYKNQDFSNRYRNTSSSPHTHTRFHFFYCLLCFTANLDQEYFIANGGRPDLSEYKIPEDLLTLIRSCWDGTPSKRPTFNDILKSKLFDQFKTITIK